MRTAYRPDIDGLRAIAVGAVILSHMGAPFSEIVAGGFIGVDIFFVISGFLITSIIYRELQTGQFTFTEFYKRRARRILPALILVSLTTIPLGWKLMSPEQFQTLGQSLIAISLFASNIYFWRTSGYFSAAAEETPMIHTWSLAVEEQFYLLFPLAAVALWRRGWLAPGLILGLIGGLAIAEYYGRVAPVFAFYLPITRMWELLAGSLAGYGAVRYGAPDGTCGPLIWRLLGQYRSKLNWLAAAGLVISIFSFDGDMVIPGAMFLLPVLCAVILLLCVAPEGMIYRCLSARPMVGVGLISYSLYLWHQPVFAFFRLSQLDYPPPWQMAVATSVVVGLAWATWAFVEQPFRNHKIVVRRGLPALIGGLAIVLTIGLAGQLTHGFAQQRFSPQILAAFDTAKPSPMRKDCHNNWPHEACRYHPDHAAGVTVLGDSHAVELAYALSVELEGRGIGVTHLSRSACPPALTFRTTTPNCSRWLQAATEWLGAQRSQTVVIAYRHAAHLYGRNDRHLTPFPTLPNDQARILAEGGTEAKLAAYWRSFEQLIDTILASGHRIVILQPIPEAVRDMSAYIVHNDGVSGPVPSVPRAYYEARSGEVRRRLARIAATRRGVSISDPATVYCDEVTCYALRDESSLYFDDDHPSVFGARRIAADVVKQLDAFER